MTILSLVSDIGKNCPTKPLREALIFS